MSGRKDSKTAYKPGAVRPHVRHTATTEYVPIAELPDDWQARRAEIMRRHARELSRKILRGERMEEE